MSNGPVCCPEALPGLAGSERRGRQRAVHGCQALAPRHGEQQPRRGERCRCQRSSRHLPFCFPKGGRAGCAGAGAHCRCACSPRGLRSSGEGHHCPGSSFARRAVGWAASTSVGWGHHQRCPGGEARGCPPATPGIPLLPGSISRGLSVSGWREEEGPFPAGGTGPEVCSSGMPAGPHRPPKGEPPPTPGKVAEAGGTWPRVPRAHLRHPYMSTHVCTHVTSHRDELN